MQDDDGCRDHAYTKGEDASDDERRDELAGDRTDMAEDRTIMAVERTFAGWIRTAFASIGVGIAFHVLFGDLRPPWLGKAIATTFILFAIFLALNAQGRAAKSLARMKTHAVDRPDTPRFKLLAIGISVAAAVLIAGLWILNDGSVGTEGS